MPSPSSRRPGRLARRASLLLVAVAALILPILPPVVADPGAAPARGATARQGQQLTLSLASGADVVAGDAVSFTGTATRRLFGRKIRLQRRVGAGGWVEVAVGRIGADGSYAVAAGAAGGGVNEWRAVARTKAKRKHGKVKRARTVVSNKVSVSVLQWYYLADLEPVDEDYVNRGATVAIGGVRYTKSIESNWCCVSFAEYNLSYRCVQFDAWAGIDDAAPTPTSADFYVTVDGVRSRVATRAIGPAVHVVLDVRNHMRVKLDWDAIDSQYEGYYTFGSARVLCSDKP